MNNIVIMALIATIGTWLVTALGAATVIFIKKPNNKFLNLMLGFASGVMIAASFWSLLLPAVERIEQSKDIPPYVVIVPSFVFGAIFIWSSDKVINYLKNKRKSENISKKSNRIVMLVLSITLHNIPEGLAVGVAFGAINTIGINKETLIGAIIIAVGIALQNFPEGAAVSFPLRREGYSIKKSLLVGQASGAVEPIAGVIGALLVVYIENILPYALSFAAGTMILVAVHELIPECQKDTQEGSYLSTMGIIFGFAIMTLLDIMLG